MTTDRIPVVILGGSDGRPSRLPPEGAGKHPLSGFKGVDVRIAGVPLIRALVDRLHACRALGPIVVAGPAGVYRPVLPEVTLVETNGSVGDNVREALAHLEQYGWRGPVAFMACDVLPEPDELEALVADYRAGPACAVWFPLIRAPRERAALGAFGWKPEYGIVPAPGEAPVPILPSHLGIVDPSALRLGLIYAVLDVAYRTRNRPVGERRWTFVRRLLAGLLYQDLRHVVRLRWPAITWTVVSAGWFVARQLRRGGVVLAELERALQRAVVRRRARGRGARVRTPLVDVLSLAEDVDTEEEARSVARRVRQTADAASASEDRAASRARATGAT